MVTLSSVCVFCVDQGQYPIKWRVNFFFREQLQYHYVVTAVT